MERFPILSQEPVITLEASVSGRVKLIYALQEKGSRVFVYTKQDEDGTLSGEQEVTTGLSDGTTVEITEGLSEGDAVYYNKTGNTKDSSSDQGGFGGGDGGPGGNGGPGGDMPSGGGNGGDPGNMPNM